MPVQPENSPDSASNRPRILLVSYRCDPVACMESRVGWNRAVQAARHFDTWVVTENEVRGLPNVAGGMGGCLRLLQLPHTRWENWLIGLGQFYPAYRLWHARVLQRIQELHAETPFQLVHQVNLVGFREPGFAWQLAVPFIWGPWGGTQNFPTNYLAYTDLLGGAREVARSVLNKLQFRFGRRVRHVLRAADTTLVANSTAQCDLQRVHGVHAPLLLETGISDVHAPKPLRDSEQPLRILWSGRLRAWKALPLLLHALAELPPALSYELRVLGEGASLKRWKRLAARLGLARHVIWLGRPAYPETLAEYRRADLFAFTSLRDTSGAGLLESLAAGTPIVGVDHQGARDVMTDACAIRVEVSDPARTIAGFRDAIVRLARDPELLARLGRGAVERAEQFLWSRQGDRMNEVYARTLGVELDSELAGVAPSGRTAAWEVVIERPCADLF